jgi:hypothetical protein
MASGLEFISSLNDSLKSSASTYIKSKSAEHEEAQKILDSIDKEINYRERLITRYQSSATRDKQSFGAYSQMFTKLVGFQDKAQVNITKDRLRLEKELQRLKETNENYYSESRDVEQNTSAATGALRKGTINSSAYITAIKSRFNTVPKISNEGRLAFYASLKSSIDN